MLVRSAVALISAVSLASCGTPPPVEGDLVLTCPPQGTTATWENSGEPFVTTWCTGCHHSAVVGNSRQGAPAGVDFDTFQGVAEYQFRIYARAVHMPATMPPAGGPTDEVRGRVGEWLACGMPGGTTTPPVPCTGPRQTSSGDLSVASQADADAFCAKYDAVGGDLVVGGVGEYALPCLCEVNGSVSVEGSGAIGLEAPTLSAVGGDVIVVGNPSLASVDLSGLLTVGGSLRVEDNGVLRTADVSAVEDVVGDALFQDNALLDQVWTTRLYHVGGAMRVNRNSAMDALYLDRIETVGGDLEVMDNPGLRTVFGDAYQLISVGGDIRLRNNRLLTGFYGFIELISIGGDLEVSGNDAFDFFYGFTRLEDVGGSVTITDNDALEGIDGFDFLDEVPGTLTIARNPSLRYIDGFRVLAGAGTTQPVPVAGTGLVLEDMEVLEGFGGLMNALTSASDIVVRRTAVPNLAGLGKVQGARSLVVEENTYLVNLDGTQTLLGLSGDLVISSNPALTTVVALEDLSGVGGDLRITNNTALTTQKAADLVAAIGEENIGGTVTILGNAP